MEIIQPFDDKCLKEFAAEILSGNCLTVVSATDSLQQFLEEETV
jgi:hypothetical protein